MISESALSKVASQNILLQNHKNWPLNIVCSNFAKFNMLEKLMQSGISSSFFLSNHIILRFGVWAALKQPCSTHCFENLWQPKKQVDYINLMIWNTKLWERKDGKLKAARKIKWNNINFMIHSLSDAIASSFSLIKVYLIFIKFCMDDGKSPTQASSGEFL